MQQQTTIYVNAPEISHISMWELNDTLYVNLAYTPQQAALARPPLPESERTNRI